MERFRPSPGFSANPPRFLLLQDRPEVTADGGIVIYDKNANQPKASRLQTSRNSAGRSHGLRYTGWNNTFLPGKKATVELTFRQRPLYREIADRKRLGLYATSINPVKPVGQPSIVIVTTKSPCHCRLTFVPERLRLR